MKFLGVEVEMKKVTTRQTASHQLIEKNLFIKLQQIHILDMFHIHWLSSSYILWELYKKYENIFLVFTKLKKIRVKNIILFHKADPDDFKLDRIQQGFNFT